MTAPNRELWGAGMPGLKEALEMQRKLNVMQSQMLDVRTYHPSRRIYSPWWTVALIFAALLAIGWCSDTRTRADSALADYIGRYDRRLAESRVARFQDLLELDVPVVVAMEADDRMPPRTDAFTTKSWLDSPDTQDGKPVEGCTIHVTRFSIQRASILAHEVCHCKNDYRVLGAWGYVGVSAEQRRVRERSAKRCEDELMQRGEW